MKKKVVVVIFGCIIVVVIAIFMIWLGLDYTTLHLSPTVCGISLDGVSPQTFCDTEGAGTWLEGKYLSAKVDKDGCLILILRNEVIDEWKNTFLELQVLQCVFGDSRDIGIDIDYSMDFIDYMEDARTCGYEISSDYTRVIVSPEDNHWYYPVIMPACIKMQMLQGKTCSEIRVEFLEINASGEIIDTLIYPDDVEEIDEITNNITK